MRLENINLDCVDSAAAGTFWAQALGAEIITREPTLWEARLHVGEFWMDLCFETVPEPGPGPREHRLHLDLAGGPDHAATVERLIAQGARPLDICQGEVAWTVLADPEGRPFCVLEDRPEYQGTGPIAALPLDSTEPARDVKFWQAMTGWDRADHRVPALRHPSGQGPLLELCPEQGPKGALKNRMHLDVRPTDGQTQEELVEVTVRCGAEVITPTGRFPWTILMDPSGNEFCILAAA